MIKPFDNKSIYTHTMKELNTYHDHGGEYKLSESLRVNPFSVPPEYFESQKSSILAHLQIEKAALLKESYATPIGYFDELQTNILLKIAEQKLKDEVKTPGFEVDAGYFESAAEKIRLKIFEEKLAGLVGTGGFTTPDRYFAESVDSISTKIQEQELRTLVAQDGYTVPVDYFETMEQHVLSQIKIDQGQVLETAGGFEVSTNYFERLSDQIKQRIIQDDQQQVWVAPAPSTPIRTLPIRRVWTRYASAAALVALIGTGSYISLNRSTDTTPAIETVSLDEIPDEAIVNYLAQVSDGDDLIFLSEYLDEPEKVEIGNQVEDDDIKDYLNYML